MNRRWRGFQNLRGFTLVELIVVIAVIGILATVTVIGFSRYQADTRDARRVSSVTTISEALEKYYDKNGEYPGCSVLTGSSSQVVNEALQGINVTNLRAPQSSEDNSLTCQTLTINGPDTFEYVGDGSSTCSSGASCLSYTLKYKEESTGTIKEVESRRQASIATSNIPTVTVGTLGADNVALSWTPAANATGYTIQRATNSSFTTGLATSSATGTSATVTGLSSTTLYYFRVAGTSSGNTGEWSETVSATTLNVGAPTITGGTMTSATALQVQWSAGANALTYNMQRSSSPSFTSPTSYNNISALNYTATSLTTGSLYYFRVQSVNGAATSTWSNTFQGGATNTPTGIAASAGSCGAANVSWTASTGATSYNIRHDQGSPETSQTVTGISGTSTSITGLGQGATNYFRVYALIGAAVSQPSSSANTVVSICGPSNNTLSGSFISGAWTVTSNATCPAGTTLNYAWTANGSAWQSGNNLQTVSYPLNYGQSISIGAQVRCYNGSGNGPFQTPSNSPLPYTRSVPAPTLNALASGGGRRINASWSNVCNGSHQLWLRQGGYTEYSAPLISGVASPYSLTDTRVWNSSGTVRYNVQVNCNGVWSGWSNEQSRSV